MNKAIKYRLYPTTEQAVMFAKTFGCCRKVY
ncbi:MAG: helix-turn-helix domain-containing protein, partial [Lachnospiraceae bacterium]|nr:helix-turn-helix domain-containing protein [Lachnospiraceae bacterium]MBR4781841.1 helix-turn-helix domain-containing protein [Lachnospiraceae bacterium]